MKNVKFHDLFMFFLPLYFMQSPGLVNELWGGGGGGVRMKPASVKYEHLLIF